MIGHVNGSTTIVERLVGRVVSMSPSLSRWTTPDISQWFDQFEEETVGIDLEWETATIALLDDWVSFEADGIELDQIELDAWDGTLPPEFVAFMDEHFKRGDV